MRVPLLTKRQIDEAKAKDKAQEVAEGLKLTRRVDGLRELASETEASYEKYRIQTIEEIQKQIDAKVAESDSLDKGIENKKGELLSLSGSIDKAWLHYVKSEKAKIAALQSEWEQRNADVIQRASEYEKLGIKTFALGETFIKGQKENKEASERIAKLLADAEVTASDARNKAAALLQEAENKHTHAVKINQSAKLREQNVLLHEQTLKRKEDELEDREMKVLAKELLYYSPVKKQP